jgi:hypothetical protein
MPEKETVEKAQEAARQGKAPTTQAGEFVREEMEHIRRGKHGARSTKQAIAIGLSKARRAGVKLPPRGKGTTVRTSGRGPTSAKRSPSPKRSRAISGVLKREPRAAASHRSLSRQAHQSARRRGPEARRRAALKAVQTKGSAGRRKAALKAARTRQARQAA